MPLRIIEGIQREGKKVLLFAFPGITTPELIAAADEVVTLQLTQLGKMIRECRRRSITEAIFAGRIEHRRVFSLSLLKFDWTSLMLWWNLKDKRADTLLKAIAETFHKKGIEVLDSTRYLQDALVHEGVLTKKEPSKAIWKEIHFGMQIARALGAVDVGQTVVVKEHAVVAVEAMEGTDACIQRAGELAGKGCVVVKLAKPQQDMRFDVPVIGVNTLQKLAKIGAVALAVEADKTLFIDSEALSVADELGLVIVAVS
jgi:hypothetical protein